MAEGAHPNIRKTLFANLPDIAAGWYVRHFDKALLTKWQIYGTDSADLSWLKEKFVLPLLRLLAEYIGTGKDKYLALYLDERLRYAPHRLTRAKRAEFFRELLAQDEAELLAYFDSKGEEYSVLKELLRVAHGALRDEGKEEQIEVLALGDCLMNEVRIFLAQKCRALGFEADMRSMYFSATENAELSAEDAVQYLQKNKVDAIAISFFTFDGMRSFSRLMQEYPELSDLQVQARIDEIIGSVREFLLELREHTQVPFLIHDASGLPLSRLRKRIPFVSAIPERKQEVLNKINAALAEVLYNVPNCIRIYEQGLVQTHGARRLAADIVPRWLKKGAFFHTSALGEYIAKEYAENLEVLRRLRKTKVLLVDFDNTLWYGVMADGSVVHYVDKQTLLRQLKEAGMLLVAVSKNSEENIRWDEMFLKPEDFALRKINWSLKTQSIQEAADELNLGIDSFVFIDDNPLERELVSQALPQVQVADATIDKTWEDLRLMLKFPNTAETEEARSRTEMYQAQVKRQAAVRSGEDYPKMMASLGFKLTFRLATAGDLSRLYELINRTNQFNTTTIRYSKAELKEYIEKRSKTIWVAELEDKFSKLGIIGALTTTTEENFTRIDSFVMSCRAMGYKVEQQMLFELLRAQGENIQGLIGRYIESPKNGPCRGLYKSCGFRNVSETDWVLDVKTDQTIQPVAWISVSRKIQ